MRYIFAAAQNFISVTTSNDLRVSCLKKTKLVISNDSGPAHIAAAVGVPTVSIFGRWQPGLNAERWRPLGKKVAVVIPQIGSIPESERKFTYIDQITVAEVTQAVEKVMA